MIQGMNKINYYIGTIVATAREGHELLKNPPEFQEAVIDIPGVIQGILAHPINGMNDEPRVGNPVLVTSYDPIYGSYYTYQVLKENDFIGIRASGKMIDITEDTITIGSYDPGAQFKDGERPDCSISKVIIDKNGNITIQATKNVTINCDGDATIEAKGALTTNGKGNWKTTNMTASPGGGNGPFNCVPFCAFSGMKHDSNLAPGG